GTAAVTVNKASSTVAVTASPDPSVTGQSVTVCATVSTVAPGSGTPTGNVTFAEGEGTFAAIATVDASGEACATTTALVTGTITATYAGDANVSASTGTAAVTVNPAATTTAVSATPSTSVTGQTVTICATVTTAAPG